MNLFYGTVNMFTEMEIVNVICIFFLILVIPPQTLPFKHYIEPNRTDLYVSYNSR